MIPWKWSGMTTNAAIETPSRRVAVRRHSSSTTRPALLSDRVPPTTSPNRQARSWAQIVTKWAPEEA
jgi:hypothetical protein